MVLSRGALRPMGGVLALLVVVSLVVSSATAIAFTPDAPEAGPGSHSAAIAPMEPGLSCPDSVPACPWTDAAAWLEWAHGAPLDEIITATRATAASLEGAAALPEDRPGHAMMDPQERRSVWLGWWAQPIDPRAAHFGETEDLLMQHGGGDNHPTGASEEEEGSKLGEARGLRPLWSANRHGNPMAAHPADDEDAWAIVTDRGVLYLPDPDEDPEWLLPLARAWAGDSQVGEPGPDGSRLLGVDHGYRGYSMSIQVPGGVQLERSPATSVFVIDLGAGELRYEGFSREDGEQASEWTLTDATGDGSDDLLVVTDNKELVAVDLSNGEEVYRQALSPPGTPLTSGQEGETAGLFGAPVFADATGDGVKDLYVLHTVDVTVDGILIAQGVTVTLLDGETGATVWETLPDMDPMSVRVPMTRVTGDLTGDGRADLLIGEQRLNTGPVGDSLFSVVSAFSAEDGSLLFQDDARFDCPLDPPCLPAYQPAAIVDLDGDGLAEIIGLETEPGIFGLPTKSLVVRSVPVLPGSGTELVVREDVDLPPVRLFGYDGQLETWHAPDGGGALLAPTLAQTRFMWRDTEGVEWAYRVDGGGIQTLIPQDPLILFAAHPEHGATYGAIVQDDHWVGLDDALGRTGEGFRLAVSTSPLIDHDVNGDGVPDLLVHKTAGYRWIGGRDGTTIHDVDRPWRDYLNHLFVEDDEVYALESHWDESGTEYRFGPLEGTLKWTLDRDDLAGDRVAHVQDYTGDGDFELLVQQYAVYDHGQMPGGEPVQEEPERWFVRTAQSADALWEFEFGVDDHYENVRVLDPLPGQTGRPFLVYWMDDEDRLNVELHETGTEGAVWGHVFAEDARLIATEGGRLLVQEEDEDEEVTLHVHDLKTGGRVDGRSIPSQQRYLWSDLADLGPDGPHFVFSTGEIPANASRPAADAERPEVAQRVQIHDADGQRVGSFLTVDPGGEAFYDAEEDDWGIERRLGSILTGIAGDWDRDDMNDLVFREDSKVTVRSSRTGALLAVSPEGLSASVHPGQILDLNGDGRRELGLRGTQATLAWHTYDPESNGESGEETGRLDLRKNQTQTQDLDAFFDGEKDTPMGSVWVLLAALGAALTAVRRGRDRR